MSTAAAEGGGGETLSSTVLDFPSFSCAVSLLRRSDRGGTGRENLSATDCGVLDTKNSSSSLSSCSSPRTIAHNSCGKLPSCVPEVSTVQVGAKQYWCWTVPAVVGGASRSATQCSVRSRSLCEAAPLRPRITNPCKISQCDLERTIAFETLSPSAVAISVSSCRQSTLADGSALPYSSIAVHIRSFPFLPHIIDKSLSDIVHCSLIDAAISFIADATSSVA